MGLQYNSTTANAQPIFLTEYQLPMGQAVPSTITAQLTFNNTPLSSVTYNTTSLNAGDYMQIALQANATSLSTGLYPWSITVTNGNTPTNYSGNVVIVNQASSPFGAGWSLDNVESLVPVTGGVILVEPGGTSLWFASNGSDVYTTPAGDFSTLALSGGVYTRTLTDGTKINFNSSGQETSSVDRDGNTTSFAYTSGLLTNITDMNNQVTTLAYNGSHLLSTITDPANRTATLAYTGTQLTSITDPDNELWQYSYDSANDLTKLTDPNNNATTFVYNSADRVSSVTQPDSTTLQLTPVQMNGFGAAGSSNVTAVLLATGDTVQYTDARNNVWSTGLDWLGFGKDVQDTDPLGDTNLIYRDSNGLPWMSSDPLARRTREFFNSQGNPTEIVQPDDSYSQYNNYNSFGEPGQYIDPTGFTTSYTYNSKGDLTKETDALNNSTTFAYNTAGLITSTTDPLGHVTNYGYNTLNELTTVTNALSQTTSYGYNTAGQRTSLTDARGFTSTFAFDPMNRLTGETLADTSTTNSVYSYSYDKVGNQTSETDPLNHSTSYAYDKMNRLSSVTDALSEVTSYTYDANGNETGVTNPLNQTTTLGYDAANRQTTITNALNQTTTIGYDAAGEKTSVTDPLNHTTTYGYTQLGQLASATDPLGDIYNYTYNSFGDNTSISQTSTGKAVTHTTTLAYNSVHEKTSYTDANDNQTTYGFDAAGNLISAADALGHTTTYGYNAINQLTSVEDALGNITSYSYDADGNRTTVTDPLGHTTTTTYDAQGRVLTVTSALSGTTSYTYDVAGNQTSITDPVGNVTSYTYDAVNRLSTTTNPMGYTSSYGYNAASELTSLTEADGRALSYTYDAVGRKTGETWVGGGYSATWTYDAAGNLSTAQDTNSDYSYGYDAANRLTSVDNNGTPGVTHLLLTYGYDVYNNRTSLTDSLGGNITYGFDNDHQLTSLRATVAAIASQVTLSYDAAERLAGMTRTLPGSGGQTPSIPNIGGGGSGDTIVTSYAYDNANRLTNITHTDTTKALTLASYTYGYDAASELTSYQDNSNSSLTYGYDKTGQLLSATGTLNGSSYGVNYTYDLNGNRTMTGYTTGKGNELTSDGTYNYTYDNNGNTLTQTNITSGYVTYYTWDYRNRLTEVKQEDNHGHVLNDEKFTYDVNNNRIGVSLNGTQQLYTVYDGANPYMDFNGSGTLTERYLTNPQALSQFYGQVNASGSTQWFLTDNLNSIRLVVSTSGSSQDTIIYDPYGNIVNQTNSANAPRFLYTGAAVDSITGFYGNGMRWETPTDGRFTSEDPLDFRTGDTNLFRYVFNSPADTIDPSGMEFTKVIVVAAEKAGETIIAGTGGIVILGLSVLGIGLAGLLIYGDPVVEPEPLPIGRPFPRQIPKPRIGKPRPPDPFKGHQVNCTLIEPTAHTCKYKCTDGKTRVVVRFKGADCPDVIINPGFPGF